MKLDGRDEFQALFNVSRETMDRLDIFVDLIQKWNSHINLISRASIPDLWVRHMVDSAQLLEIGWIKTKSWADFGSGGGFPGLVLAMLAADSDPEIQFTLVESDTRKASFLKTVLRDTDTAAKVLTTRVEMLDPMKQDCVSARALAPLSKLLGYAARHLAPDGVAIFPKGSKVDEELETALASWRFAVDRFPSKSDPSGVILRLGAIEHV